MKMFPIFLLILGMTQPDIFGLEKNNHKTPTEQFKVLQKKYNSIAGSFRKSKSDQEREQAVRNLDKLTLEFLKVAQINPKDPITLKVLRQAVQSVMSVDSLAHHASEMNKANFPVGSQGNAAAKVVEVLTRDHLKSEKLAPICDRMRYGTRSEFETFLRLVINKNPHREVQGMANLALAQLLHTHLRMISLATDRKVLVNRYDHIYGKGYLKKIQGKGTATLTKQIEALYKQALKYDDVLNYPFKTTIAEKAKTELHELLHLSVGKEAQDIQGKDQDGMPFKLSDYQGKVVLLYFWMEY